MYTGKVLEIYRHFNLSELTQEDPEVKAWLGQSYRAIGPYYEHNGKAPASGLSFEEQKVLLPEILGIEPEDKDFRRAVIQFYHELVTSIPKEGKKLQVSLTNDNEPLSKNNMPINVKDYVTMRHIIGHPEVAKTKEEAERVYFKKYFILDPDGVTKNAVKINELEDKSMVLYMKHKDDMIKTDQILTMMGVNIKGMKAEDKLLKLKGFAQKNVNMNEHEQKDAFNKFISVCEDKDLEYKYLIQEMIGAQYLQRVGNNIVYAESGIKIGDNMDDAVLYFRNPKNSRELNLLKAQYSLKVKKSDAYLPKDADPEVSTDQDVKPKQSKQKAE